MALPLASLERLALQARIAELAAAFDALLQMPAHADTLRAALIAPLAAAQAEARARNWHDAARTRVEFFTLARDA